MRVARDETSSRAARDANKRGKRAEHATCDRPPLDPSNLHGQYDNVEGERHNRWHLNVRWNEVVEDTFGQVIKLRRYNLEWQHSKDDGVTWGDSGRARVPAKNDDDSTDRYHYTIRKIKARFDYRFRVQSEAKDGCRSTWSAWLDVGQAEETPAAVTNVTLDIDEGTAHGTWVMPAHPEQPPQDPTHTQIKDLTIDHLEVQLYRGSVGAGNLEHQDTFTHAEKWSCKLKSKPEDTVFILRVRTVSEGGTTSVWVSTSATKNRPSQPGAPTIEFDAQGPRHSRFRALVTVQQVADTDFAIDHYRVQFVHKFVSGQPDNTDARDNKDVEAGGTNKELTVVFRGIRPDHFTFARTRATDRNGKLSAWSNWTSGGKPSAVDAIPALQNIDYIVARRRVGVLWQVPMVGNLPDERIARVEVQIATDNGFTNLRLDVHKHAGHGQVRYAVPLADVGTTFYVRIRPIDDAGNLGAWQPSSTGHALNAEPDSTAVMDPGTIFHHATPTPNVWAPAHGALYCDGSTNHPVASYPLLFAEIGYTYGSSNAGANFGVPDSKGRHLIGTGAYFAVGQNDGMAEVDRQATHLHSQDLTYTFTPNNNVFNTVANDSTATTPANNATQEAGHQHAFGGASTSNPVNGSSAAVGANNLAGAGHQHTLSGFTSQPGSSHGHGHDHGGHGHNHGHGQHGHDHGHPNHNHQHAHDSKQRPHLAMHVFIKT